MDLVLRWIHVFSVIFLVGGTFFLTFVWFPSTRQMSSEEREQSFAPFRRSWAMVVMISTLFLLVSGLWNFMTIYGRYDLPTGYMHCVATKFLLALAMFFFSARVAGRSESAVRFRQNVGLWLKVNSVLAILLVGLAGYMKVMDHRPKADSPRTSLMIMGETTDG